MGIIRFSAPGLVTLIANAVWPQSFTRWNERIFGVLHDKLVVYQWRANWIRIAQLQAKNMNSLRFDSGKIKKSLRIEISRKLSLTL